MRLDAVCWVRAVVLDALSRPVWQVCAVPSGGVTCGWDSGLRRSVGGEGSVAEYGGRLVDVRKRDSLIRSPGLDRAALGPLAGPGDGSVRDVWVVHCCPVCALVSYDPL
jgi:hypothetical protein